MSNLIKTIKRIEYLNFLIKKKATGDLETLSKKLGMSKRSIKNLLTQMRDMGADIKFNRERRTYYYLKEGEFCISKFLEYGEILSNNEASKIGRPENLCFSEKNTFIPCKNI